jgi:hypothetical protein
MQPVGQNESNHARRKRSGDVQQHRRIDGCVEFRLIVARPPRQASRDVIALK